MKLERFERSIRFCFKLLLCVLKFVYEKFLLYPWFAIKWQVALLVDKTQYFFTTWFAWERSLVPSGGKPCNMVAVTSVKFALSYGPYAIRVNPVVMTAAVWYLIAHNMQTFAREEIFKRLNLERVKLLPNDSSRHRERSRDRFIYSSGVFG